MTRRTIGLISIALAVVVGIGTLVAVPAVYAETKTVTAKHPAVCVETKTVTAKRLVTAKQTLTPADEANLQALKALYKQIRDTAKLIHDKVEAAKTAGKDLSAFKEDLKIVKKDLKIVLKSRHNLRHNVERMRKPQLTKAEHTQLKAIEARALELRKQLKAKVHAKVPQVEIDALKVQIKAAIAVRTAYLKAIHTAALANYSARLLTLIADANVKLTFLQGLLARLP